MSHLGDLIVEHGPYAGQGNLPRAVWDALAEDEAINDLREDLIALVCLKERVSHWVEMIDGDVDWSLGQTITALSEMREWAAASAEPHDTDAGSNRGDAQ